LVMTNEEMQRITDYAAMRNEPIKMPEHAQRDWFQKPQTRAPEVAFERDWSGSSWAGDRFSGRSWGGARSI
jgi:hypothetical protein